MTTKTTATGSKQHAPSRPEGGPSREEIQAAYRIHTLVQVFYARLAEMHPWAMPVPPWAGPVASAPLGVRGPFVGPYSGSVASGNPPYGVTPFPMGMPAVGMSSFGVVPDSWGPSCAWTGGWPEGSGPCPRGQDR